MAGFLRLRDALKLNTKEFTKLLLDAAHQAILGLYKVWCCSNSISPEQFCMLYI